MKVLIVSDARSIHTRRWVSSLKEAGVDIVLYTINCPPDDFFERAGVKTYVYDLFSYKRSAGAAALLRPFQAITRHHAAVKLLRQILKEERPDILHAHYATSYGLIAALSGFHPFILSVWGSDVYEFPRISAINRKSVEYMLSKADRVLSTSEVMARETRKYCGCPIGITPFGVDTSLFTPEVPPGNADVAPEVPPGNADVDAPVIFGTVKTLSAKYGIDLLLKAYREMLPLLEKRCGAGKAPRTRLVIAGKGKDSAELQRMATDLGIAPQVDFIGEVDHDKVPGVYAGIDVAVFLSREESFGVSAVEAMSCGCPVIASDAEGFCEVLADRTGILVPREDPSAAAEAMADLALDPERRASLGKAGRERVRRLYEWKDNVRTVISEYERILSR